MAKIGLQLYTVRDHLAKDYTGTIIAAKALGYDGVEFPTGVMDKLEAPRLRELLSENGLALAGIVFDQYDLSGQMERVIDYCAESGCKTALYPYIPDELRRTAEEYECIADQINGFGATLTQHGIRLLYHIHGYEFKRFHDKTGFDILIHRFTPASVGLEIDVYWVEHGGVNAVKFMEQYASRSPFIHFKDYNPGFIDTEVGNGVIDNEAVARIGLRHRVEWFIVEQEQFDKDSMESARISFLNLRAITDKIESDS